MYFAQRLDEMLFSFSLDTYKPPALTALQLSTEALVQLHLVEKGIVDEQTLVPVIDELNWAITNDPIAKELLVIDRNKLVPHASGTSSDDRKVRFELLRKQLSTHRYLDVATRQLTQAIVGNKLSEVETLSRLYVTNLLNAGYSHSYIHLVTKRFFYFDQDPPISSANIVSRFFEKFPLKITSYDVRFFASADFSRLTSVCGKFDVEIEAVDEDLYEKYKDLTLQVEHKEPADGVFLVAKNVRAMDAYEALISAQRMLDKISNLYTLFHHRRSISYSKSAYVLSEGAAEPILAVPRISSTKVSQDMRPDTASLALNALLDSFSMRTQSFIRFDRAMDLHAVAVHSSIPENQLLNLWTAFETLLPHSKSGSTIKNIVDSVVPFLTVSYIDRLLRQLYLDMATWRGAEFFRVLSVVRSRYELGRLESLGALLSLAELSAERDELYNGGYFGEFVLLQSRFYKLSKALASKSKIKELVDVHETKVRWHLRRIYRTRNAIVHAGTSPHYLPALIESAHAYLDIFLDICQKFCAIDPEQSTSIEQIIKYVNLSQEVWMDRLSGPDAASSPETFRDLLFGLPSPGDFSSFSADSN